MNSEPIASTPRMSPFKSRIGAEGERDLLVKNEHDETDQRKERGHPDEENARRGEKADIRILRHGSPNQSLKNNAERRSRVTIA